MKKDSYTIDVSTLSADEKEYLSHLSFILNTVREYRQRFVDAFVLRVVLAEPQFDGERAPLRERLNVMAFRDAVISVYNLGWVLKGISQTINNCKVFSQYVDQKKLKEANQLFAATFPDIDLIRHGVAHEGEFLATIKEFDRHASGDGFKSDMITVSAGQHANIDLVAGDKLIKSIKGKVCTFTMDESSYKGLQEITDAVADALEPALASPWMKDQPVPVPCK